eukprot:3862778-Lingulodinium_polyedra.AAC.1
MARKVVGALHHVLVRKVILERPRHVQGRRQKLRPHRDEAAASGPGSHIPTSQCSGMAGRPSSRRVQMRHAGKADVP